MKLNYKMMKSKYLLSILFMTIGLSSIAQTTLISKLSTWKYLDDGSNQGTSWTATSFNDVGWSSAAGVHGYGTITGATVSNTISYGSDANNKYPTTYFRKTINLTNPAYTNLEISLMVDDGAVIYVNGNQVLSDNMPGTFSYTTYASSTVSGADEGDYETFTVSAADLVNGNNTIAVEVHNRSGSSSDLAFDLEVVAVTNSYYVDDGDSWYYWDQGTTPTGSWDTDTNYANTGWGSGNSELGYGDGDETTTVGYGGDANNKYAATYFRKVVNIPDTSLFDYLSFDFKRDDGIVVYLNGDELFRDNMPTGTIGNSTLASATVGGGDESTWNTEIVLPTTIYEGNNVIAVSIHQTDVTSSDITFNLRLEGIDAPVPTITRGPYLQLGTDSSMMIRWSTDVPCESTIKYGTTLGTYGSTVSGTGTTDDHEIEITGLTPDTRYYYYVSSDGSDTVSGQDGTYYFVTNPTPGSDAQPVRMWVLGDQGQPGSNQDSVHSKFFQHSDWKDSMDMILMLGDNAYNSGYDSEFQDAVFDPLEEVLRNTPMYSCVGNHEVRYAGAHSISTPSTTPYYLIHNFPTSGEAGGLASGTESYFSMDYANVHIISINAEEEDLDSTTSSMWAWLENDLQQNTLDWIVVIVHQGPYTKGSHNSDSETEHIMVRENFLPLLERYGVDLMMSGHSHSYERSKLVKGHFGVSGTHSAATHDLDGGYGRMPGFGALTNDCPYTKEITGPTAGDGAVYVTCGSSSKVGGGSINHPVMKVNYLTYGSVYVEVTENRLDFYYLESDGDIADYFTVLKDIEETTTTNVNASSVTMTASWPEGPYEWSNGETTRSITVNISEDATYTVGNTTGSACISDTFHLNYPQLVRYPWTETDTTGMTNLDADGNYVLTGDAHTAADANGWYYYYNSAEPDNLLFAVRNSLSGGNTLPIDNVVDYIELRYKPSVYSRIKTGLDSFRLVFNYDWNVVPISQPNGDMDIKFYYDPTVLSTFTAVADSLDATNPDFNTARTWFKASQGAGTSFDDASISIDSIDYAIDLNSLLVSAPNYTTGVGSSDGTAFTDLGNAKNYIQFDGLSSFSGGTLTQTLFDPTPVPVEWLSFNAKWESMDARLTWQTASELNNDYFEVQRSFDGVDYFTVATIAGSGTSTSINSYSFIDMNAMLLGTEVLYYRIKQVDYDNNIDFSDVVTLTLDATAGIEVYPIPANNVVNVELKSHLISSEQMEIFVYDQSGSLVLMNNYESQPAVSLNVSELQSGWYILAVKSGANIYLERLLVE
ncbi:MAG: metallophosphoesterase [Bacteroidia bacterium]